MFNHNQQLFITILALAKMPELLLEKDSLDTQNALAVSNQLTLVSSKLDNTGFIIELKECPVAMTFINSVTATLLKESDTYGIKRYANRKTIALRVSLTGSI
jgi:hypothetical protein